jgi:hypothetical protein
MGARISQTFSPRNRKLRFLKICSTNHRSHKPKILLLPSKMNDLNHRTANPDLQVPMCRLTIPKFSSGGFCESYKLVPTLTKQTRHAQVPITDRPPKTHTHTPRSSFHHRSTTQNPSPHPNIIKTSIRVCKLRAASDRRSVTFLEQTMLRGEAFGLKKYIKTIYLKPLAVGHSVKFQRTSPNVKPHTICKNLKSEKKSAFFSHLTVEIL